MRYKFLGLLMFVGCLHATSANSLGKSLNFLTVEETNSTINSNELSITLEKKEIGTPLKIPKGTSSAVAVDTLLIANVGSYGLGGSGITKTKWKAVLFTTGSAEYQVGSVGLVLNSSDNVYPATVGVRIAIFSVNSGVLGNELAGSAVSSLNLPDTATLKTLTLENSFTLAANTQYALVVQSNSSTGFRWANVSTLPSQSPTAYRGYTYNSMQITTDTATSWSNNPSTENAFTFSSLACPIPSAPTAAAIQRFCSNDTVASLQATVAAGETLSWFANLTGGSALTESTTLTAGNYYAQATSTLGCASARTLVVVSFNNALYFDGSDDYVGLSNNSIPDGATEFTIEAWIKPDNLNFDGNWHAIFGRQVVPGQIESRVPSLYIKSDSNMMNAKIHLSVFEDNTLTDYGFVTPTAHIIPNVWSHLAIVKEGLKFKVYVNGIFVYEVAAPNAVNITGAYQMGYVDNYYAGLIDDVRFWNTSRSALEISSKMNETLSGTETGLVDYYTFDQGIQNGSNADLTNLYDNTASANNGTLNNFALTGATSNYVPGYFAQITGTSTILLGTSSQLSHVISGGSWSSFDTNIATVSNSGLVTSVAVGSSVVSYTSCGQTTTVTITVTVPPTPSISNFNNINKTYFDGSFSIAVPTSNSAGSFSYTSSNTAVATISGTTVTILGEGTSTITANQAVNGNFSSGSITATLTITAVSILTKEGGISGTNINYVNQYGKIGGNFGLNANGAILNAKSVLLSIGDEYQGGKIAYILVSGDSGYEANVQHGLIAAIADQDPGPWSCMDTQISGADGIVLGTGNQNTIDIEAVCTSAGTAADLCFNYTNADNGTGVYSDWYLPSKDELSKLYSMKLLGYGNFNSSNYWSSTEYEGYLFAVGSFAWNQDFSNGVQIEGNDKSNSFNVRAMRSF